MNTDDLRKLMDLFLDDDLPLELSLEFKQAMFSDHKLSAEVSEARRVKEMVSAAYREEFMTDTERQRVLARISAGMSAYEAQRGGQLDLPLSGQFPLPINPNELG
jgi:hypothetical protein